MKKTFGIIVTFCLLFFVALTNVSNAEVVKFGGKVTQKVFSDIVNETDITFSIDTSTNKATVSFQRGYVGWEKATKKSNGDYSETDKKAIQEGYASEAERYYHDSDSKRWESLNDFIKLIKSSPSSGIATCDVKIGGYYKYELTNFTFNGEKYALLFSEANRAYYPSHVKIVNNVTVGNGSTIACKENESASGSLSCGLQITENVSTPVAEEKKHFTMLVDNFSFINTATSFIKNTSYNGEKSLAKLESYPEGTYGYFLPDSLYKALTENMNQKNLLYFHEFLSSKFKGSCHGMSNLAAQIYLGKFKVSDFSSNASKTFDIEKPVNNKKLAQTLTYYQLAQYMNLYNENLVGSGSTVEDTERAIKTLKDKGEDCLAILSVNLPGAHAVLAYKFAENSNGYVIECYDPNSPREALLVNVSKDYKTVTTNKYDTFNIRVVNDPYLLNENAVKQNLKNLSAPEGTIVKTPAENVSIKTNSGEVQIKNGEIVKNTADANVWHPLDGDCIVEYIWEEPIIEIISDGPITYGDDDDVIIFEEILAGPIVGDEWILDIEDGEIEARSKNGKDGEISIEYSNTSRKNRRTKITAKAGKVNVKKTDDSVSITTDNGSMVDVEIGDLKNTKYKIDDVDTSKKNEIKINDNNVEVKENGTVVKTVTENGEQKQPGTIDITLIINKAKDKAKDFSQRLIERIKAKNDTVNKFKNKGYKHSTWAEDEVARADELGIIPYSIINKLQSNITRKEFCEIAYQTVKSLTGMTDSEMKAFCSTPDTSTNPYAYQYSDTAISFAYGTGIVNGYPDGSFGPNDLITRAQAAKMLVVTAEIMGKLTSESGAKRFNDNPYDWSQTYINKISSIISPYTNNRVMGGDDKGNFMPLANYTCEQAVLTMQRLIENVIGENASYNGGTVKPEQTETSTYTLKDNDMTNYNPKGWSWTREGTEGYGRKYFTSGKYVREDGRAVLYIESSDSPDSFAYQLYALPEGAKQSSYESYKSSGNWSYAENTTQTGAYDMHSELYFWEDGRKEISVTIGEWMDELIYAYGSPEGLYKLVREK